MQYRIDKRSGRQLSILGYGCMRFPRGVAGVDMKKSEQLVINAVEKGVNYFDTAYLYPGSEAALGEILAANNIRDKVNIATKLPITNCTAKGDFEKYFKIQLERLQTDYIDYYLMHNINNVEQWKRLCELGIEDWLERKKAGGSIKQAGFSFHGTNEEFTKVLNAYDWDFCQIQYNYSDENYQAGVDGLKKAAEKNIPVIIMEPLLGGSLAKGLSKKATDTFSKINSEISPAAWALKWLWNQPEVTVVLSGMNDESQLEDNLKTADMSRDGMLTDKEKSTYTQVVKILRETYKVPCTGCGYCMPCPQNVNIPACFSAYNASHAFGRITGIIQYVTGTAANRKESRVASLCIGCGKCQRHCPQNIEIPKRLKDAEKRMEPFYFKWGMKILRYRNEKA